jgi:excisionase family DNA binding protein
MLTVDGVAALLDCSPRTVYRLADKGQIPAPVRLGTLVRWNRRAIDAWISAGCPTCRNTRT